MLNDSKSLAALVLALSTLLVAPGVLTAQQDESPSVGCSLDYDGGSRSVLAEFSVRCPGGRQPVDTRFTWHPIFDQPLRIGHTMGTGSLKVDQGVATQPMLPAATLDAMCASLAAQEGKLQGSFQRTVHGRLEVWGFCSPDGPKIYQRFRTRFTIACGGNGVDGIHSPSSTNDPEPPDLKSTQEWGFHLREGDQPKGGFDIGEEHLGWGLSWRRLPTNGEHSKSYFELSLTQSGQDLRLRADSPVAVDFDLWNLEASHGYRFLTPRRPIRPFVEAGLGWVFVDQRGGRRLQTIETPPSFEVPTSPDLLQGLDEDSVTVHLAVGLRLRLTDVYALEPGVRGRWRESTGATGGEVFLRLTFGVGGGD